MCDCEVNMEENKFFVQGKKYRSHTKTHPTL